MSRIVEEWAEKNGLEVAGWLGSGDFGEAYATTCDRVIKLTGDIQEFAAAFQLQGTTSDCLANIEKAELTDDDHLFILMEQLDTEGIEDVFSEAFGLVEEYAFGSWEYFDVDELPEDMTCSDEALQFIDDICSSIMTLNHKGIDLPDIQPGNIGRKNGSFVLFDFRMTEHRSFSDFKTDIRLAQSKKQKAGLHNQPLSDLSFS